MKDGCSSDLGAIVVGDTAVHGEDFPILRGLQEPIVPENTASFVPPSSISHMPTYPCPSQRDHKGPEFRTWSGSGPKCQKWSGIGPELGTRSGFGFGIPL